MSDIKRVVCYRFGLSVPQIEGPARSRHVAWPRALAMKLSRDLLKHSLPLIGSHFNRDHTTVIAAIRRMDGLIQSSPAWEDHYNALKAHLTFTPANDTATP